MLTISDSVEIAVAPTRVWEWLCELPAHYAEWHPDHRECRVLRGDLWNPSAVVEMEEILHGRRHRFRFEVVDVTPGREIIYRAGSWLRGRFLIEPVDGHCRFTAALSFGPRGPGRLLDRPLAWLFRHRIAAARRHQSEEGRNLKRLLEGERRGRP